MKVKILQSGTYADFEAAPNKCGAVFRAVGDEIDYPEWYAGALIVAGMAEVVKAEPEAQPEVEAQPEQPKPSQARRKKK